MITIAIPEARSPYSIAVPPPETVSNASSSQLSVGLRIGLRVNLNGAGVPHGTIADARFVVDQIPLIALVIPGTETVLGWLRI